MRIDRNDTLIIMSQGSSIKSYDNHMFFVYIYNDIHYTGIFDPN